MESTFTNMLVVLTTITCIAGFSLGGVYMLTAKPIEAANKAKQENAIKSVAPEFNNSPTEEKQIVTLEDGSKITVFPAKMNNTLVGAAVESFTKKGFSGEIKLMVGFNSDGTIRNYIVLQHAETPGLGSKMNEWFREEKGKQNIIGKNPSSDKLTVSKDGGDVDAITAATISSRAFLDAVQRGYEAFLKEGKADIATSASSNVSPEKTKEIK